MNSFLRFPLYVHRYEMDARASQPNPPRLVTTEPQPKEFRIRHISQSAASHTLAFKINSRPFASIRGSFFLS